ncbi:MAG: zinc-finger domain-containing protein [Candidatus Paracaedibacteraceae bacterium]|nr:zinc-finger domain-containing protein [Candidatus Paracaedibacteraceae bacterium]
MIEDIRYVDTKVVNCDGNSSHDGLVHPSIYLTIAKEGKVECPYCSRTFIYEGTRSDPHS